MRHLKKYKIFESSDDSFYQDLLDNFSYITDNLGEPHIDKIKWANSFKWIFSWNLGINLNEFHSPTEIVNKLNIILTDFEDVVSAESRIEDHEVKMLITNERLKVSITPLDTGDSNYEFIKRQDGRDIIINVSDIERYLKSKGISVKNIEEDYQESLQMSKIHIETSEILRGEADELKGMFEDEVRSKYIRLQSGYPDPDSGKIDRDVQISVGSKGLVIYSDDEKTYIVM